MTKRDITALDRQVRDVQKLIGEFADEDPWAEILKHIHQPGWTTPAEFRLVAGAVQVIDNQMRQLMEMRGLVLKASAEITEAARQAVHA